MEHYRSTLGTAAAAVCGLVVAARVLHPGNFEDSPRAARPVRAESAAKSAPAAAKFDPPFALHLRPTASSFEMTVLAPHLTAPLPVGMTMMPILAAAMAPAVDQPREAGAQDRRRATNHFVRAKPAVAAPAPTAQASSTDARSTRHETSDATARDLIRDDEG